MNNDSQYQYFFVLSASKNTQVSKGYLFTYNHMGLTLIEALVTVFFHGMPSFITIYIFMAKTTSKNVKLKCKSHFKSINQFLFI